MKTVGRLVFNALAVIGGAAVIKDLKSKKNARTPVTENVSHASTRFSPTR